VHLSSVFSLKRCFCPDESGGATNKAISKKCMSELYDRLMKCDFDSAKVKLTNMLLEFGVDALFESWLTGGKILVSSFMSSKLIPFVNG
jgi:hypothetical protein